MAQFGGATMTRHHPFHNPRELGRTGWLHLDRMAAGKVSSRSDINQDKSIAIGILLGLVLFRKTEL